MIIFWQGLGLLALAIPFVLLLLTNYVLDEVFGHGFYSSHDYSPLIAMTISAVTVWFVGKKLNTNEPERVLIDQATGEKIILRKKHTFFFIQLQWWALIYIIFGLVCYFI